MNTKKTTWKIKAPISHCQTRLKIIFENEGEEPKKGQMITPALNNKNHEKRKINAKNEKHRQKICKMMGLMGANSKFANIFEINP